MLDYRAWIIACVVLLSASGACVVWLHRARATYTTRSLSAAPPPAKSAEKSTKSLHVDGCNDDFIVSVGELVEPRVTPGSALDRFRDVYGKEMKSKHSGSPTWDRNAFLLTEVNAGLGNADASEHISVEAGHVVETLDGIELGIDAFGTIFRKMRDRGVETHEHMDRTPDGWKLTVSFYSACGHRFRSEYSRTFPSTPDMEKLVAPRPTAPDDHNAADLALANAPRSDVFMNKIAYEYTMAQSGGQGDSSSGQISTHN